MAKLVQRVLALRFSAMGDVAMTAAALREFAPTLRDSALSESKQAIHFTMVSRPLFAPFFEGIDNVDFIAADFNKKHKGLPGLWRLFHELRRRKPDVVVDLHDVLRTKILRLLFRLWGFKVRKINKGRREKHRLTRRRHKQLKPLKHTIERYTDALSRGVRSARYEVQGVGCKVRGTRYGVQGARCEVKGSKANQLIIHNSSIINPLHPALKLGIAPFAKYKGKIYPIDRMEKIVSYFAQLENVEIFLFGGGPEEINLLAEWASKYKRVVSLAGKMPLSEELRQLAAMDVVVSMDSANMHLASLVGVPVVSIWGATHPFAGFTGWKQQSCNNVQIDLPCRPCSVFGNKPCFRNDYACMDISEQVIIEKITTLLDF